LEIGKGDLGCFLEYLIEEEKGLGEELKGMGI